MSKVVLVTGGSRGIGAATVEIFARHGYDIVINYCHRENEALQLKNLIEEKYGVSCLVVQADVSLEADVIRLYEEISECFGKLDVIVNNAGIAIDTVFEDKSFLDFQRVLNTNLVGPFLVSKHLCGLMKKGAIVNVGSTNGINSYYEYSMDYDASKAGLHILTKDLAIALGPDIRVNAVAPGWVMTEMNQELDSLFIEKELEHIVLGRFATSEEIGEVIYYLASEEARYVNGSVIVVDGGRK